MRFFVAYWPVLALACCTGPAPQAPPAAHVARPGTALFPIVQNGRWGFIDSTGAVVIAPRFAQVQRFAGGLAPVRAGGRYGYIDKTGKFVLPPAYAYATPFHDGLALVEQDSVPRLIDHTGRLVPLPAAYRRLEWYPWRGQNGIWTGDLPSYATQLLTRQGQLFTPTQFARVGELSNNRLVVVATKPLPGKDGPSETEVTGALDGRGRLAIPYRRFDHISAFREGRATAALYQAPDSDRPAQECIIDTAGQIVARLPRDQMFASLDRTEFADGVTQVLITKDGRAASMDNSYPAAIDRQGRVLFRQPDLQQLSAFCNGRAWAQTTADQWHLIDKTGRRLPTVAVKRLYQPGGYDIAPAFGSGAEVAELASGKGYVALDSEGRVVGQWRRATTLSNPQQLGELLVFSASDSTRQLGFWNWRTGLLLQPRFSAIDPAGYQHGLLAVVEAHRLGYLSPAGRYVWREAPRASGPLDLDIMRRSAYYVASAPLRRYAGFGGWGRSGNLPHAAGRPPGPAPTSNISLAVAAQATANAYAPGTNGHRVTITNVTADTVVFNAQDSRLYMTLQALNSLGQWRDIEYMPSSFCGNSYHQVFLAPGQGWQLVVPAYQGAQPTLLRARLLRRRSLAARQVEAIYSNTFRGGVNPAQFWHREGYVAQDIMDPYYN